MTDYRVYILGDDDRITRRVDLDCAADDAAIEYAKQHVDGHDIELWRLDRRVVRLDRLKEKD
jgi:hypothetical protein